MRDARAERELGLLYGLGAYGLWGFIPVYFKAVASAPPLELLSHRVVWALGMLLLVAARNGMLAELREALGARRTLLLLAATTALIAANWLLYIYAVVSGRILEGSLGYYINPLVNVLLGVAVLGERLERPVVAALVVAAAGVLWLTLHSGHLPWLSLSLALTFGLYGLLRKLTPVGAVVGLLVETALLLPAALGYLAWARSRGELAFLHGSLGRDLLLLLAGPVTAIPLLLFTGAARRLPLSTIGFLQYLSPTTQFLLGTLVYGEPFTSARGVAFGCTWVALAIFAAHTLRRGGEEPVTEA